MSKVLVAVSGGFDPIHVGHIRLIKEASKLGDCLVAIVNNDDFLIRKKGFFFMPLEERLEIVGAIKGVSKVFGAVDEDDTVCKSLEIIKPQIFANGGDRTIRNIPEVEVCRRLGIKMVFGVGGEKIRSSSSLLEQLYWKFKRKINGERGRWL
jgi:D-beta-D-heptose 7-phosphate kinase/D-beta-D-heptose 1-phosphate adenosyltransferase